MRRISFKVREVEHVTWRDYTVALAWAIAMVLLFCYHL